MNLNQKDLQIIFKKLSFKKKLKINKICINSKEAKKKSIFFAIKGKNTDGHFYAKEALQQGAEFAVVKNSYQVSRANKKNFLKVSSPLKFLEKTAQYQRNNSKGVFIGVTGSFGKTTLKFMLSFFLKKFGKTYSSPKSFNNHFGLPLSLSNTPANSKYNIFELGMSDKGEIEQLSKILNPDIGVITNIGPAHLKNLKTLKKVCLAKSEIMNHIKKDGVVFLNKEDDYFGDLKIRAKIKKLQIVTFAKSKIADVQLLKTVKKNRKNYLIVKVFKNQFRIETKTFNDNFVVNYLITLSVFSYLGLDLKKIIKNAKNFPTPSGRGDLVVKIIDGKKVKIINESYNANPISMKNAIENFSSLAQSGKKKVAIIGDMLELGLKSKHYHEEIAELLINSRIDHVHLIGKEVAYIYQKLKKFKKCNIYNNINHFGEVFSKIANDKSIFLIKGSNGIGLSKLLNDKL